MNKVSFYDTKPYDKIFFEKLKEKYNCEIIYHEAKLCSQTAVLSSGCDCVCAFVNDTIDKETIQILYEDLGIKLIAMRCAGFNNIDLKCAYDKMHVVRVPAYSPYAVAEATMGMLLLLNRKLHKAYIRTRDFNFSLNGLVGFDLHGKTIGIIGTGKIGRTFIDVCSGFGMDMIMYDPYPIKDSNYHYVPLEELFERSDIISLHCPLTKDSHYIINEEAIRKMKEGVFIINTSRGALIDSEALLEGLLCGKIGAAGLDVYEEESDIFFEDLSEKIIQDHVLARLVSLPNVLVTSHQAFLTKEALENIATTTLSNIDSYFKGEKLENEVCYQCSNDLGNCQVRTEKPCF